MASTAIVAHLTLLLPPRARFGGQRLGDVAARALGCADHRQLEAGDRAQMRRHVSLVPDHWPLAALTRRMDAADSDQASWLRADPAHVRPGINGATLLACGDMLALMAEESAQLLQPLRLLFGDTGFPIDAPRPGHWYLRLPYGTKVPAFSAPARALGADVFEHTPDGDDGRRWRALLSEAQVILHNHPVNVRRAAQGRLPVNSVWFWGGGVMPDHVATPHALVQTDDEELGALMHGVARVLPLPHAGQAIQQDTLVDLRHLNDLSSLEHEWLRPALRDVASAAVDGLQLDFGDGSVANVTRGQRWRFWRKPIARPGA